MTGGVRGKEFFIAGTKDGGNTWLPLSGVTAKGQTRDNPVSDTTSQSTTGFDTESEFTGFGTLTLEFSGTLDKRGAGLYTWLDLQALVWSGDPQGLFKISDGTDGVYECDFNITNLQKTAEQNDLVKFSGTMQNKRQVFVVPEWYDKLEIFNNVGLPDVWENLKYGTDFS